MTYPYLVKYILRKTKQKISKLTKDTTTEKTPEGISLFLQFIEATLFLILVVKLFW